MFIAGVAVTLALAFYQNVRGPLLPVAPDRMRELVVMIGPGPAAYFAGNDGALSGFDADLARRFAAEKNLPLRFAVADSTAAMLAAVARGDAHIAAGGLYGPPRSDATQASDAAASKTPGAPKTRGADAVLWTIGYAEAEPLLIYNRDGYRPSTLRDLDGETVAYVEDQGFVREIAVMKETHPGIRWERFSLPSVAGLVSQVSDGTIGYAIIGSIAAAFTRNIYLDFEVAFPVGRKRDIAWAVSPKAADLKQELDSFIARLKADGTLARLIDRYMPDARQIARIDAGALQERARTLLPQYRSLFLEAQEKTGIEWRLLAAIAYQESQWDPAATSETGVRGFMQLTEETARHLRISNALDPAQSILGAARYLRDLKDKMPARIREPERTWLALAAFNIGLGHLEDARILAQRQKLDPDLWADVKKVLPLLAQPEYYEKAKLGYARGGMPVAFVDRVRGYYDVLLAHQPSHQPRLRPATDSAERLWSRSQAAVDNPTVK